MSRLPALIAFMLCLSFLTACGRAYETTAFADFDDQEYREICSRMQYDDVFSNYYVENAETYHLRSVKGRVIARSGFEWPSGEVLVAVHSLLDGVTHKTSTNNSGRFRIDDLAPGRYCYIVFANGWQAEDGRILISRDAPRSAGMDIELILDN